MMSTYIWAQAVPSFFALKFRKKKKPSVFDMARLVTRGYGFESRLRQELYTTEVRPLSKAPNPRLLPGAAVSAAHCSRCVCTWMG